jgi:hypothetical protein
MNNPQILAVLAKNKDTLKVLEHFAIENSNGNKIKEKEKEEDK